MTVIVINGIIGIKRAGVIKSGGKNINA